MEALRLKLGEYTFLKGDEKIRLSYHLNVGRFHHEVSLGPKGTAGENLADAISHFSRADKPAVEARIAQLGSSEKMRKELEEIDEGLRVRELTLEEAGQETRASAARFNGINRGYLPAVVNIGPSWAFWHLHTEETSLKRPWMVLEDIKPEKQLEEPYRIWAVDRNIIVNTLIHSLRRTVSYRPIPSKKE